MKIAYLIPCHEKPDQIALMVRKLTEETGNIAILHVDIQSDEDMFKKALAGNEHVCFVKDRVRSYWGSWNGTVAIINCMRTALQMECERYVVFQPGGWPIRSNEEIDSFFSNYPDIEFVRGVDVTNSVQKFHYMKSGGFHFANANVRVWDNPKSIVHHFISAFNKLGIPYRRRYYLDKATGTREDVYWGWIHVALTRKCVEYILSVFDNNDDFNRYMKHVFPSDETYIPTVVFNSSFAKKTVKGQAEDELTDIKMLTYFEYPPGRVRVFDSLSELDDIDLDDYLYIRKVSERFIHEIISKDKD